MRKNPYALCGYKDCDKKSECKRFTEDKEVKVILFEKILEDNECVWFIKKNLPK